MARHVDKQSCECAQPWGLTGFSHLQWAPMRGISCQPGVHSALVPFEVVDATVLLAGELRIPARDGSGD